MKERAEAPDVARKVPRTPIEIAAPFRVTDLESGRILLEVVSTPHGPALRLFNAAGHVVVELRAHFDEHGTVEVFNGLGRSGAQMNADQYGGSVTAREATDQPGGAAAAHLSAERHHAALDLAASDTEWNRIEVGKVR